MLTGPRRCAARLAQMTPHDIGEIDRELRDALTEGRQWMKCLRRVRKRLGRCYELAFRIMFEEPGAEKFALVHGHVSTLRGVIGHAWIEIGDGRVYDPVLDRYVPAEDYIAGLSAVIERRYTKLEAAKIAVHARYYGPWHEIDALPS